MKTGETRSGRYQQFISVKLVIWRLFPELCFLGAVLFSFRPAYISQAAVLNVQGRWSVTAPTLHVSETNQYFEAYVDGDKYYFIVECRAPRFWGYTHSVCDGTDSFYIRYPADWYEPTDIFPVPRGQPKKTIVPGAVHQGLFPTDQPTQVQILWLALIGRHDATKQTNCPWPMQCLVDYDVCFYNQYQLRVVNQDRPYTIEFLTPGAGTNKDHVPYYFPAPYDKGFLYSAYRETESTKNNGIELPSDFTFTEYIEKQSGKPASYDDVDQFRQWNFTIASVKNVDNFPAQMPITVTNAKIIVNDYRILSEAGEPVGFQLGVNGEFLSRSSSAFKVLYDSVTRNNLTRRTSQNYFYIVFKLLSLPPIVLIIRKTRSINR